MNARLRALAYKEILQLLRDRATLGMLLGVPLLQIVLFGCAIELTPRSLAVQVATQTAATAARVDRLMRDAPGIASVRRIESLAAGLAAQTRGEALVVVDADARPIRVYLDATDPSLALHARAVIDSFGRSLADPFAGLPDEAPAALNIVERFNPGARTQPFIVAGLLGLILTMAMVMMSALSLARERERGTLEALLALEVRPLELALGKLAPYVLLAAAQATLVLLVGRFAFDLPLRGSLPMLTLATLLFACANLALGFAFSALARQQMQAMQMTFFFFLPSALLSGFMFPFQAMPAWARLLGEGLPLTHYLRIVRNLLLRGADSASVLQDLWPIALFAAGAGLVGLIVCRWNLRRAT